MVKIRDLISPGVSVVSGTEKKNLSLMSLEFIESIASKKLGTLLKILNFHFN